MTLPVLAFPSGTTATASEPPRNGLIAVFALEEIRLIDPVGGSVRELPGAKEMSDPAWSPDGKTLAVTSWSDENFAVYTLNADGSDRRLVLRNASTHAWSPDGERLVVARECSSHSYECASGETPTSLLATVRADGTDVRELVLDDPTAEAISSLAWSPDGNSIAFVDQASRIKIVSAEGDEKTARQVATDATSVAWSPDGSSLAFDRYVPDGGSTRQVVVVLDLATRKETVLRGRQDGALSPVWSPDGTQLAFLSTKASPVAVGGCGGGEHTNTQLWAMALDGTNARRIAKGFFFGTPSWARSLEPVAADRSRPAAAPLARR